MAIKEVLVPDIGDYKDVPIIEVLVKAGDRLSKDDPLITLESEKAAMDIPAPYGGVVREVIVKVGDKVSQGSPILTLETDETDAPSMPDSSAVSALPQSEVSPTAAAEPSLPEEAGVSLATVKPPTLLPPLPEVPPPIPPKDRPAPIAARAEFAPGKLPHASPSVRRFARELGVDLSRVKGSGPRGRILKEDVQAWVKAELAKTRTDILPGGLSLPPLPSIDHAKFGEIETQPLSRVKKISGANLARNWIIAPHVTQFDEADITELENFRKSMLEEANKRGVKLTLLSFLMKATVSALRTYPIFNASLAADSDNLILKKYFHIGFACETPEGLVVPVIRDVDQKGVWDIARELGDLSARARERKLRIEEMQGGCFTITSLGGIGGTAFTPIINCPEVAILGVSRAIMKPVWDEKSGSFVPRLMLPLSLSYDHRVIDGADGARFTSHLRLMLSDVRRLLL